MSPSFGQLVTLSKSLLLIHPVKLVVLSVPTELLGMHYEPCSLLLAYLYNSGHMHWFTLSLLQIVYPGGTANIPLSLFALVPVLISAYFASLAVVAMFYLLVNALPN